GGQVHGLGDQGHDDHRQQQDEQQGTGQLRDDDRHERVLARAAKLRPAVPAASRPPHGSPASVPYDSDSPQRTQRAQRGFREFFPLCFSAPSVTSVVHSLSSSDRHPPPPI